MKIPHILSAILLNNKDITLEKIQEIRFEDDLDFELLGNQFNAEGVRVELCNPDKDYNEGIQGIRYDTLKTERVDNIIVTIYAEI